jgi:hypothetical protein
MDGIFLSRLTIGVESLEARSRFAVTAPLDSPFRAHEVATATNGELTVVVRSAAVPPEGLEDSQVFAHLYDDDGEQIRRITVGQGLVDDADDRAPAVAMAAGGSFVVVWKHGDDLLAQKFDAAGDAETGVITVAESPYFGRGPSAALNNAGEFVVALVRRRTRNLSVFARMYAADGALRHEVAVARSNRNEFDPDVAMNRGQRGFDIVYTVNDTTEGRSDTDIILARYRSDGTLRPEGKRKAAATDIDETQASVAISPNGGRAIVSWIRGDVRGGDAFVAAGRRYSRSALGDRFRIGASDRHVPADIAIFNSGIAIANFNGFVYEDVDDRVGLHERIDIEAFNTVSLAVASNDSYVAAASDGSLGEAAVDDRGWLLSGVLNDPR